MTTPSKNPNTRDRSFLGRDPIGPLLARLSLPAMVGMLVMASYQVVDGIFIGRGVGTHALGSITVAFPLAMLLHAVAIMIGVGGASVISRALGAEDHERAETAFGNVLLLTILAGAALPLLGFSVLPKLVHFFGGKGPIAPYSRVYLEVLFLGIPFQMFGMAFNNLVRAEGEAKTAMVTMLIGALVNVVLDWHFIFNLSLGIRGAALATIIGQGCSALWLFSWFFLQKKSVLAFSWKHLRPHPGITGEILAIGASDFARMGAVGMVGAVTNNAVFFYGGPLYLALMGIVHRTFGLIFMPIFGISQGTQPIVGFNVGARKLHRSREVIHMACWVATLFSTAAFLVLQFFPLQILGIFSSDPELLSKGVTVMRIASIALWLVGFQVIGSTVFQALGKPVPAMILSLSRQVLCVLPLMLILPRFFGIIGVISVFPTADLLAAIITFWLLRREMDTLKTPVPS